MFAQHQSPEVLHIVKQSGKEQTLKGQDLTAQPFPQNTHTSLPVLSIIPKISLPFSFSFAREGL